MNKVVTVSLVGRVLGRGWSTGDFLSASSDMRRISGGAWFVRSPGVAILISVA